MDKRKKTVKDIATPASSAVADDTRLPAPAPEITADATPDAVQSEPLQSEPLPVEDTPEAMTPEPDKKPDLLGFAPEAPEPLPPPKPAPQTISGQVFVAAGVGGLFGAALLALGFMLIGPFSDVGERINALESGLAGTASRRASETNEKRILTLEGRFDALKAEIDAPRPVEGSPPETQQKLAGLEQGVTATSQRIERLEKALATKPVTLGPEASQLTLALLLRERLEDGTPFSKELGALAALGVDPQSTAALQPYAANGAPGPAQFVEQFEALLPALRKSVADSAPKQATPQDWTDRLSATIAGAVRVTKNNEAAPASNAGVLERIDAALKRGAFDEAATLWGQLSEPVRSIGAPWNEALAARIKASQSADALISASVEKLTTAARAQGAAK